MASPLNHRQLYDLMKPIVDDMAREIGQFDPSTSDTHTRSLVHSPIALDVIVLWALLDKGVLTVADLTASRDAGYATSWISARET